jgi:hypothetical protein
LTELAARRGLGRIDVDGSRWRAAARRAGLSLTTVARLTTAVVLAYLLTVALTDGPLDLTGPLTALLVVQASAYSTVRMGIVRVGAVVTGVLVAVALSAWVGLSWWSLGVVVAASLLLAEALRLGEQTLETAISAMLILGVGGQEIAAETRVVTTLIGAAVGVLFNLVLPPPVPTRAAADEVREVAADQAAVLASAGAAMSAHPVTKQQVTEWLERSRGTAALVARASARVEEVRDVRWLNARAIGTADVAPVLRSGLTALERSQFAVRALLEMMLREAPEHPTSGGGYGEEVRPAFAVVLEGAAECLATFGALVQAEVEDTEADVERNLEESLDAARETRAVLTELMLVDARGDTGLWMLRGSVLAAVDHVLEPLEVEHRERLSRRWTRPRGAGGVLPMALLVREMLPAAATRRPRESGESRATTTGRGSWRRSLGRVRRLAARLPHPRR